jgi:hypothetical protein
MTRFAITLAALALLAVLPARAQLFKCKGPDGKIVYSDQRCEAAAAPAAVAPGVSNRAHAIEEKAAQDKAAAEKTREEARIAAEARVAAEAKAAAEARKLGVAPGAAPPSPPAAPPAAASAAASAAAPARPSGPGAADQERLRNLQVTRGQPNATSEQKSAAQIEIDAIRSGRDSELSSADRDRRDSLSSDLRSLDPKKRKEALQELRNLYR